MDPEIVLDISRIKSEDEIKIFVPGTLFWRITSGVRQGSDLAFTTQN
jgi:hypothetical protein